MEVKYSRKQLNLDMLKDAEVRLGWFSGQRYEDGVSIAQVARWNEYGTWNIPSRPFMRTFAHTRQPFLQEKLKSLLTKAIRNNTHVMDAFSLFGEYSVDQLKTHMEGFSSVPNSPVTVKGGWIKTKNGKPFYVEGKGFNKPLYDTGTMINAVSYQVIGKNI